MKGAAPPGCSTAWDWDEMVAKQAK